MQDKHILMVLTMALQTKTDNFRFHTTATGNQVLVASFLVYETKTTINVADFQNKTIVLKK
jgi:hypothetical protein